MKYNNSNSVPESNERVDVKLDNSVNLIFLLLAILLIAYCLFLIVEMIIKKPKKR